MNHPPALPPRLQLPSFSKKPYISAKEPYISAKEAYISTKELYISAKEHYNSSMTHPPSLPPRLRLPPSSKEP